MPERNVNVTNDIGKKVRRIMAIIDAEGASPLPLDAWIEVLTDIRSECDERLIAAREDLKRKAGKG